MKTPFLFGTAVWALLLLAGQASARKLVVTPGTGTYPTIQSAATVAVPGDTIVIRGGTYYETLRPTNSGTASQPIVFINYPGEKVVISAADRVTNWQVDNGSIYSAPVSWTISGGHNQVFVDDEIMIEARYPNIAGESELMDVLTQNKVVSTTAYLDSIVSSQLVRPKDYWKGGIYWGRHGERWAAQCAEITGSQDSVLTIANKNSRWWWSKDGATYKTYAGAGEGFITGLKVLLDQPKEWFYDAATKRLYLWAPGGQDPNNLAVYFKRRTSVIDLSGRSYIVIRGLNGRAGGIDMDGSTNCTIQSGTYKGLSHFRRFADARADNILGTNYHDPAAAGVYLSGQDNKLERLTLSYSAGPLVRLDGQHNTITNSTLQEGGYGGTYGGGIFIDFYDSAEGSRGGHTITHNVIKRISRAAVAWNNCCSNALTAYKGSTVSYNDISSFLMMAADGGALNCYWTNLGSDKPSEWSYNWIYEGKSWKLGSGPYPDNYSENVRIHHNVIRDVQEGVRINTNAKNIEVYNNTFWNISERTLAQWLPNTNVKFYNNLSNNSTLQGSLATGTDFQNNLVTTTPQFVASGSGGLYYRLQSTSPAVNAGKVIPGITDGYVGSLPDIGAYEYGAATAQSAWRAGLLPATSNSNQQPSAVTATAITDYATDKIKLYPNPVTNGILTLSMSEPIQGGTITVTDINGKTILTKSVTDAQSTELNFQGKTAGTYLLNIVRDNKKEVYKVIVN